MAYVELELRCAGRVRYGSWGRDRQCERKGTFIEDEERWCASHAPTRQAARRTAAETARRSRWARELSSSERNERISRATANVIDAVLEAHERGTLQPELEGSVEELIRARS